MTERKTNRLHWVIMIVLWLGFILNGCNGASQAGQTPAVSTDTTSFAETPTNLPVPTETPQPAKVVLITAGMDEGTRSDLSAALTGLASESNLLYEERTEFLPADIGADWRAAVLFAPETGLPEAVAANPNTQFIVYSSQDLTTSVNLNIVKLRKDKRDFIAGYLSTVITPDWRTAGLFAPDAAGDLAEQAFINGGEYLCGLCNSYYAPLVLFPLSARVSGSADPSVWRADLDTLLANIIYTVYISPESENPALWDILAQGGQILVGSGNPPEALKAQWAASVMLDTTTPLAEIWSDVMAGQGGKSIETPVKLTNINENYLTPGKKLLVDNVLKELDGGWIHPLDIP